MIRNAFLVLVFAAFTGVSSVSASTIDLANYDTGSGSAALGGTFYVDWINEQSTGTGVISSFLVVQATGGGDVEQGYSTGVSQPPMNAKAGTDALLLSNLISVTINSQTYYEFLLDIGQDSGQSDEFLSLNQIQIFQSTSDRADGTASAATTTSTPVLSFPSVQGVTTTEIFRMNTSSYYLTDPNSSAGSTILLDASRNSGNGSGDMMLFIPTSLFSAQAGGYVIFYSQFGAPPGPNPTNDGPEEWALFNKDGQDCITISCGGGGGLSAAPEPASMVLLGTGLLAVGVRYRRRKQ